MDSSGAKISWAGLAGDLLVCRPDIAGTRGGVQKPCYLVTKTLAASAT